MKAKDAYMFPVIAGCFLVGLYLLFKFINKEYVNLLLNIYFLAFGFFALVATLHVLIESVYSSFANVKLLARFKFTVPVLQSTAQSFPLHSTKPNQKPKTKPHPATVIQLKWMLLCSMLLELQLELH